ncbi:MAG: SpoIIE family protein phosphatase [bacterium]|nr:SpoIIE family protein phosphatase [bacterium]
MRRFFRSVEEQALLRRVVNRLDTLEQLFTQGQHEEILQALEKLRASFDAWNSADIERQHNELLSEVALSLSRAIGLEDILSHIVEGLAKLVPFDAAGVFIVERDGKTIAAEYLRGYRRDSYELVHQKVGEGIVGRVVETGKTMIVNDVSQNPYYIAARKGTRSELAVPMFSPASGEVIGVFNLESNNLNAYTVEDAELVSTLAANAAVAIEREQIYHRLIYQQRIQEELALARRIQQSLLPANTNVLGLDIYGLSIPSEQVGGDYYDFFTLSHKDLAFVMSDVVGKGIPAAIIMAGVRGSLRVEARTTYSIGQILEHVNNFVHSTSQPGEFVTIHYGVVDVANFQITYSNAGHNPAMLLNKQGEIQLLSQGGVPIGAFPEGKWTESIVPFHPGDTLLLYTDGVTEAENPKGQMFTAKRLMSLLQTCVGKSAKEIIQIIQQEVVAFTEGKSFADDMTLLAIVFEEQHR